MNPDRSGSLLVVTVRNGRGRPTEWRLSRCPACGEPLPPGPRTVPEHIEQHEPEDFGLSALGERRPAGRAVGRGAA